MTIENLHTLTESETDPNSEFKQKRFSILSFLEGKVPTPYFDSKGMITIGIGFNIDTGMDGNRREQIGVRSCYLIAS
jgi:GH24 family phage-related lysozyme (muramidase)